jgi:hypothetical protein
VGTTDEATGRLETLLKRIQDGGKSAKSEVIRHSCERLMSLANKMMRQYRRLHRWEELDDVVSDRPMRGNSTVMRVPLPAVLSMVA